MSRLLVDGRVLETASSGVRDVAHGLVSALREQATRDGDTVVVAGTTPASDLRLRPSGFMELGLPIAALRGRFDAVFVPRQTRPPVSAIRSVPLVHDVGFERCPEVYRPSRRVRLANAVSLKSRHVLCVSSFTASEIRRLDYRGAVTVLPLGAMHRIDWNPVECDRYLLCVAVHETHKNLVRLVEAWGRADTHGFKLVICGRRGGASNELEALIEERALTGRVRLVSGLPYAEYSALLEGAWAYIQPSLYEGLCIPALDMAAAGVPSVVSASANLGAVFSHSQVVQTFDPYSPIAIALALEMVIHDPDYRARASRWNRENVALTNWEEVGKAAWGALR